MKDKRVIGSVALAIVLVVVLIISVIDVIRVRSGNLVATVQPFEQLDLNFTYSGTITSLPVASGERVKEGQILAVESVGPISQKVSANEATVAADEANLASLVAPTLPSSEASTLDLKVSQAQQAVQASQSAFNNITSAGNQLVSQYRTLVSSAQAALSNDQSLFQTACPNGVTPPPSTASVSSGQSTLYATCLSLSEQVANDQKQLSQAQAELSSAQAQVINDQNQATAALQNANSQLGLAQNGIAVATAKGSNAQIQSAKAQLANDQAQLAYDESILSSLMLRAPVSGVVEDVNGNIGGVVGSSGVSQYYYATTPQGASSQSGGLNSVESGVTNSSNSTKNALVVLDVTSRWYVTVDVPQSELDTLAPGSRVTISLPGVSDTFTGKVGTFEPIATQVNGQTYYEVRIDMKGAMPKSVLPGMTGSATVG